MSTYTRRSKFWRRFLNSAVLQNFLDPQWQSQSLIMLKNEAVLLCSGKITTWRDTWLLSSSLMFIEWDNLGKMKSILTNSIWESTLGINNSLTGTRNSVANSEGSNWIMSHRSNLWVHKHTQKKKIIIKVCLGFRICYMYNLKIV